METDVERSARSHTHRPGALLSSREHAQCLARELSSAEPVLCTTILMATDLQIPSLTHAVHAYRGKV